MDNDYQFSSFLGWVARWVAYVAIGLVCLYLLLMIASPVIEVMVGIFSSVGGFGASASPIFALAVLCVVVIGVVGAIKANRKGR